MTTHDALQAVIRSAAAYDWPAVSDVRALPSGFVAQAFALTHAHQTVFVKCYDRQRAITARVLRSNQFALPVTAWLAAHTALQDRIVAPIACRDGSYVVDMGRFVCVAFAFHPGVMPCASGLSPAHVTHLATTIGLLHAATARVPLPEHVEREDFRAAWSAPLLAFLTDDWQQLPADVQQALAPKRTSLCHMLERFVRVGSELRAAQPTLVLCHTDIHCMNMLVDGDRTVLLDFEGLKLAPPEHDFMFVQGEPYWPAWHAAYQSVCGHTPMDPQRLVFYQERRLLEDIYEWVEQLHNEPLSSDERRGVLSEMRGLLQSCPE